jgi:hypothetical protein
MVRGGTLDRTAFSQMNTSFAVRSHTDIQHWCVACQTRVSIYDNCVKEQTSEHSSSGVDVHGIVAVVIGRKSSCI